MPAARAKLIVNDWNTVRYELLNTRICDLGLKIRGSTVEPLVIRVCRELSKKGLRFQPVFYLTDSWGCPDKVPAVGIPFYLAETRLARIEEEQTGEVEDSMAALMFLRHELGHALNYAYRLWERKDWSDIFGHFSRPYRDVFTPDLLSRDFVRHLVLERHGRSYAQKHPDEDFAETFAIWVAPRSNWRQRYRLWPAARKLYYVDRLMRSIRMAEPRSLGGKLVNPVEGLTMRLAEHYGQKAERYRAAAQGYVDDKLRDIFPETKAASRAPAVEIIRRHRETLRAAICRWSDLDEAEVEAILDKLQSRAGALRLEFARPKMISKVTELSSLATALAMDFSYTGRFTR